MATVKVIPESAIERKWTSMLSELISISQFSEILSLKRKQETDF